MKTTLNKYKYRINIYNNYNVPFISRHNQYNFVWTLILLEVLDPIAKTIRFKV